jgi:hypothetical protein
MRISLARLIGAVNDDDTCNMAMIRMGNQQ